MTDSPIKTRREDHILEVTLDRPKANAIDLATSRIMGETFMQFRDDPELRIAILRAEGDKFFCPGWDLKAAADGDAVDGTASIQIIRSEQKAYFYKGSQLVGVSPISTGKSTHTTPPGRFKISQKSADHKSSLYGVIRDKATGLIVNSDADTRKHRAKAGQVFENAPMPYFMRFNSGIGMHVGHLPGYAASHGCVRMPEEMAVIFFENVKIGTPVIVK